MFEVGTEWDWDLIGAELTLQDAVRQTWQESRNAIHPLAR